MKIYRAAALLMLAGILCGCSAEHDPAGIPEQVTLLIEDEKRIITLDYTDYIAGCIFAAADPSFQEEALKAAGAACSGRALYCMENAEPMAFLGADLADSSEFCPAWISFEQAQLEHGADFEEYSERVMSAAEFAAGVYPEYGGAPADTPVCPVSAGITDEGDKPYLPSLELECDKKSPRFPGSCTVTASSARKKVCAVTGSVILPPDKEDWFTRAEYTPGGTLLTIRFGGAELTGEQLRAALGLRSTAISITIEGDMFTFSTQGEGSNRGLSAYAAERLARGGKSAEEILDFFFPGTTLRTIDRQE